MATQCTTESSEPQYDGFFVDDQSTENDAFDNTSYTSNRDKITVTASSNCDDSETDSNLFPASDRDPTMMREDNDSAWEPDESPPQVETPQDETQGYLGMKETVAADENAVQSEQSPPLPSPAVPVAHEQEKNTATPIDNENEEKTDFDPEDDEIQRDAANDIVALVVHAALAFFALMFIFAIIGSILLVASYGFVTLVLLIILVGIVVSVSYLVTRIIVDDQKLKPVRRKMRRWQAIAKAVVINEVRNFQLDMRDHQLLLTYGEGDEASTEYEEFDDDDDDVVPDVEMAKSDKTPTSERNVNEEQYNATSPQKKKRKGPRSMVFRIMVKPFLKEKTTNKRSWLRRKKKQNGYSDMNNDTGNYVPPVNQMA